LKVSDKAEDRLNQGPERTPGTSPFFVPFLTR
jgi:hypothetical protein